MSTSIESKALESNSIDTIYPYVTLIQVSVDSSTDIATWLLISDVPIYYNENGDKYYSDSLSYHLLVKTNDGFKYGYSGIDDDGCLNFNLYYYDITWANYDVYWADSSELYLEGGSTTDMIMPLYFPKSAFVEEDSFMYFPRFIDDGLKYKTICFDSNYNIITIHTNRPFVRFYYDSSKDSGFSYCLDLGSNYKDNTILNYYNVNYGLSTGDKWGYELFNSWTLTEEEILETDATYINVNGVLWCNYNLPFYMDSEYNGEIPRYFFIDGQIVDSLNYSGYGGTSGDSGGDSGDDNGDNDNDNTGTGGGTGGGTGNEGGNTGGDDTGGGSDDDTGGGTDEELTTEEEQLETSKGILGKITEFFDGFKDMITGLFVPSKEEMGDLFSQLDEFFNDKFGFLYYPFDFIIEAFNIFLEADSETGITLPGFSIMGYQVWSDHTYDITSEPIVGTIFGYVRMGTGALLAMWFVNYLRNFFDKRFGGGGN